MERLLRSTSLSCSSSGREPIQVHRQVHIWLPGFKLSQKYYQHRFNNGSHNGSFRPTHVHVRSQSPRQQGGDASNKDADDSLSSSRVRITSSLVTYGLSGTLAVVGAAIAHIDLFGQFRWLSTDDLRLGLTSASLLMVLEGLLLGPPYDRLLAGTDRPGAKAGAVGLQLRTARVGELLSADSVAATLVLQQACVVAAQVVRRAGLTRTSALLEGGLVLVREASKELLQRGLLFTFLAAWLADRAFEAGTDDTLLLPLPAALLGHGSGSAATAAAAVAATATAGVELYVTDAARYLAGLLVTASVMPAVAGEAEAMRVGVASNLALVMVEQQQEAEMKEQWRRRQQQQQQLGAGSGLGSQQQEGGTAEAYDEDLDSKETEAMLREYRLYDALGRCTSTGPPRLTYALTLLRGLLRFGAPNLTFALTGNLAASFLSSALPALLLLGYVLRGPRVLLESSFNTSPEHQADGQAASAGGEKGKEKNN
ncbi:hypothetical protein Vretimale_10346 [Volvox reticuliferus]|uniref:Uncharacterized protein n=2 Tax=Volvox reticuliferus TaxID=1737510 RepID=A0A8J4LR71_9CHLO|nr:hypothetical protein Vretifemale_12314 [Volvox reticuliferus]GIM05927.1 hypothetical protein Vretimale_10346 [Volvox reticuliferus]